MAQILRSMSRSGFFTLAMFSLISVGFIPLSSAKNSDNLKYQYPATVVEAYVGACGSEATEMLSQPMMQDICLCTIEEFQQYYSLREFRDIGQTIAAGGDAPSDMKRITSDCVQQVMLRPDV